jgi:valyl-tRNA synthetase
VVPFITEALWQQLPQTPTGAFLAQAAWPVARRADGAASTGAQAFEYARDAVQAIRSVRSEYNVNPGAWVDAVLVAPAAIGALLDAQVATIGSLARARVTLAAENPGGASAQLLLRDGVELVVPLAGMVDLEKEKQRLQVELDQLETQLQALDGRLANEKFVSKAPPALVEAERAKAEDWRSRCALMRAKLGTLGA